MTARYKAIRIKRKVRTRSKIKGTANCPRLSVFRSNKAIYAQLIDDEKRRSLVAASEKDFGKGTKEQKDKETKGQMARMVGEVLAKKAIKKGIKTIVFDRGSYRYHGRVKALAEGARSGGLKF